MITMSHRIARVARRHQVRWVIVRRVPIEVVDIQPAGHRPSPVDPLLTPVASVRAVPDGVEQDQPVFRDQPARTGQHMFRGVHRTAPTVMDHDVAVPASWTAFSDCKVAVPFDPGVMPAAHPLRKVCFGAPGNTAQACFRSCLLQAERVAGLLPAGVMHLAPAARYGVSIACGDRARSRSHSWSPATLLCIFRDAGPAPSVVVQFTPSSRPYRSITSVDLARSHPVILAQSRD